MSAHEIQQLLLDAQARLCSNPIDCDQWHRIVTDLREALHLAMVERDQAPGAQPKLPELES